MNTGCDRLQQVLDQKPVHLKKRKMAHSILKTAGLVNQISRTSQLKAILALVQQQEAIKLRQRLLKRRGQFSGGFGEVLKCDVERDLRIGGVRKSLNLQKLVRQSAGPRQFLKPEECFRKQWR